MNKNGEENSKSHSRHTRGQRSDEPVTLGSITNLDVVKELKKEGIEVRKRMTKVFNADQFGTTFDTLREMGIPTEIAEQMKTLTEDAALALSYILRSINVEDINLMSAKEKFRIIASFGFLFPKIGEGDKHINNYVSVKNYKEASVKDMEDALTEPE